MLVREVMTSPAVTVTSYTTAQEALRLLDEFRVSALPVVDDDGAVVGLLSEVDVLVLLPDITVTATRTATRVRDLMTHPAITVSADCGIAEAVALMRTAAVRSMPVVLHGRIVGMVSRSDLVRLLAHADDLIRYEVLGRLRAEGAAWQVDVTDRVVIITGPVTDRQRHQAAELARSVTGVADVRVH